LTLRHYAIIDIIIDYYAIDIDADITPLLTFHYYITPLLPLITIIIDYAIIITPLLLIILIIDIMLIID
jgi:hypothetical protein